MDKVARLLTPAHNGAVVQLPGRNYPGVVIQGDTLNNLVLLLRDQKNETNEDEKSAMVDEVLEILEGSLRDYFSACAESGIDIPWEKMTK
ncbi:MAG: hypothetical protein AAF250_02860 [Pseudomonadota bacterium]